MKAPLHVRVVTSNTKVNAQIAGLIVFLVKDHRSRRQRNLIKETVTSAPPGDLFSGVRNDTPP